MRDRAIALRRKGYSYAEICSRLGNIPHSTLSYWFQNVRLTDGQQVRIQSKILASAARGRPLARVAWARKMRQWRTHIEHGTKSLGTLPQIDMAIGKLVCGVMYMCEGGKYPATRYLKFANTDPAILRTFLALLRRCYPLDESKLRLRVMHRWDQDGMALQRYWSRITQVPLKRCYRSYADKRTKGAPTKKRNYKGVGCIHYFDTSLQYELQAIGEAVLHAVK